MSLLASLEESPLAVWIRESEWGYPIVLISHTLGMAFVVGGVLAFDLRVLLGGRTQLAWFGIIFRLAWIGFAISLLSGAVLFSGAAQRFLANPAFQIKLACLAFGGFSIWLLARRIERETVRGPESATSLTARIIAACSITLWVAAITAGRLMAYIR